MRETHWDASWFRQEKYVQEVWRIRCLQASFGSAASQCLIFLCSFERGREVERYILYIYILTKNTNGYKRTWAIGTQGKYTHADTDTSGHKLPRISTYMRALGNAYKHMRLPPHMGSETRRTANKQDGQTQAYICTQVPMCRWDATSCILHLTWAHTHTHADTQCYTHTCLYMPTLASIHACMHTYIHTAYLFTYPPTYPHTNRHTHIHTYIHACMHTYIHGVHTHIHPPHTYICTFIRACIQKYRQTDAHTHMMCIHTWCTHMCTYLHTCMHASIHPCMHTYTHTYSCIRTHIHAYNETYVEW